MNHRTSRTNDPRPTTRFGRPTGAARTNPAASRGRSSGQQSAPRRRPLVQSGEFEMPVSSTPSLPAVDAFAELDMPAALLATLTREGLTEPFPIQGATLPNSLAGRDVLGRGRTGSGKTLAFGLALLARTAGRRAEPKSPLALVLVPTRELAQQVADALTPYATSVNLRLTTVVGGMSITRQSAALRRGVELLIATPGRLKDLIDRGDCRLDRVSITVLDEADQMADMGFLPQVTNLLEQVQPNGQTMLFSATLDRNVDRLVRRFLSDPVTHSVDPSAGTITTMDHHVLYVADADKRAVTVEIAAREGRVIMFMDTKHATDKLAKELLANGVRAASLHGGKSQPQRNRVLEQFRDGHITALVATNVAARGIHVDNLDLVVNVDPPTDHKDYLHRGGRTARAGESGTVVTLVLSNQRREMTRLMADAGITPNNDRVRSGDAELSRITGARKPSGVPVVITAPAPAVPAQTPRKSRGAGSGSRGGSGAGGRSGASAGSRGGAAGLSAAQPRSRRPRRSGSSGTGTGGARPSRSV